MPEPASAVDSELPDATSNDAVPAQVRLLHRLGLFLVISLYFFISFAVARALLGDWGLPLRVFLPAAIATVLMSVFVIWLAPFLALPEIWYLHVRPERRAARGLCPGCGHPRPAAAASGSVEPFRCSECGSSGGLAPPWQCTWPTIRSFLWLLVTALAVGMLGAALWCRADESRFEREAASRGAAAFERARAWPADFARMHFDPAHGFRSSTFIDSEPIAGWRPRDAR